MLNPWMIIGVICVVLGTYKYGTHTGYKERDAEMQQEIARLNEESRAKEQKMAEDLNKTSSQLKEANDVVTQKQTDLAAAIRAGRVRLPTASCIQSPASAPVASGNHTDAAESDRQTLLLIAELAAEGDRAINKLNACITAYEQVREAINGIK
jgi:hypothetical protein